MIVLIAILLPACVLSDRESSEQEEYYLKNYRNNPKRSGRFMFVRNNKVSRGKDREALDIVAHNHFDEQEDYTIPKILLFVPLVGAWMAVLVLVREVSPRATTLVSIICRRISDFTKSLSERTAALHEQNHRRIPRVKRKDSSRRRERNQEEMASSVRSLSESLMEIASIKSDDELDTSCDFDNSGSISIFSSFRRAKTVVASNIKRESNMKREQGSLLREPSPLRGSPSKNKPTRMRRTSTCRENAHYRHYDRHDQCDTDERMSHQNEHTKRDKSHRNNIEYRDSSRRYNRHVKSKQLHTNEHEANVSPLEKKLSSGSHKRGNG